MKKKIIFALMMALSLPVMADNVPGMVVTISGGTVKEYIISNIDKITYDSGSMVIATTSGGKETISTDDIAKITLGQVNATGIENVTVNNSAPVCYSVYTVDGVFYGKGTTTDAKALIDSLPNGKFVIDLNGKTIKVVK